MIQTTINSQKVDSRLKAMFPVLRRLRNRALSILKAEPSTLAQKSVTREDFNLTFGKFVTFLPFFGQCSPIFILVWCGLAQPGLESVEETCFLCHFYRERRFVTHTFTSTTLVPKSTCLLIFCTSALFTDCSVCGRNWSKHRNQASAKAF